MSNKETLLSFDFNQLAKEIHQNNVEKGFWGEPDSIRRDWDEAFMLIITEIAEAVEAHRKGKFALDGFDIDYYSFLSDEDFTSLFVNNIKDTFEDEIADTLIRVLDIAGYCGVDMNSVLREGDLVNNMVSCTPDTLMFKLRELCLYLSITITTEQGRLVVYGTKFAKLIVRIFNIAEGMNFDLIKHVHLKVRYNKTRSFKHGKSY